MLSTLNLVWGTLAEEFERRFPSRYTWSTAIPGPSKKVHKSLGRRCQFQTGLFDSGYESSRGQPIPFEEQSVSQARSLGVSTDVRRRPERVRITIMRLLKEHRHFLKLFRQTDSARRKALLRTITLGQIKALSEIAHNIIKFRIALTPSEKVLLRRSRRQL